MDRETSARGGPPTGHGRDGAPTRRHRRRGVALEQVLLTATWEELHAVGYRELSMDAVAARAATSKPVLYRRWPNRAELVLASLRQQRPMLSGDPPDTGSLREDVLTLLRRVQEGLDEIGLDTLFGLLSDLYDSPELGAFIFAQQAGLTAMAAILESAARRGEIVSGLVPARVATLPIDLARNELLLRRTVVPDAVLIEIVDVVFLPLVRLGKGPAV